MEVSQHFQPPGSPDNIFLVAILEINENSFHQFLKIAQQGIAIFKQNILHFSYLPLNLKNDVFLFLASFV